MGYEKNGPIFSGGSQSHGQSPVGLIWQKVRDQIEIECFDERDRDVAESVALMIAEVFALPDRVLITIDGEKLPVEVVRDMYARITHEHVATVTAKYRKIPYQIKRVKTYMRTALYNAVLESELDVLNFPARAGAGE